MHRQILREILRVDRAVSRITRWLLCSKRLYGSQKQRELMAHQTHEVAVSETKRQRIDDSLWCIQLTRAPRTIRIHSPFYVHSYLKNPALVPRVIRCCDPCIERSIMLSRLGLFFYLSSSFSRRYSLQQTYFPPFLFSCFVMMV